METTVLNTSEKKQWHDAFVNADWPEALIITYSEFVRTMWCMIEDVKSALQDILWLDPATCEKVTAAHVDLGDDLFVQSAKMWGILVWKKLIENEWTSKKWKIIALWRLYTTKTLYPTQSMQDKSSNKEYFEQFLELDCEDDIWALSKKMEWLNRLCDVSMMMWAQDNAIKGWNEILRNTQKTEERSSLAHSRVIALASLVDCFIENWSNKHLVKEYLNELVNAPLSIDILSLGLTEEELKIEKIILRMRIFACFQLWEISFQEKNYEIAKKCFLTFWIWGRMAEFENKDYFLLLNNIYLWKIWHIFWSSEEAITLLEKVVEDKHNDENFILAKANAYKILIDIAQSQWNTDNMKKYFSQAKQLPDITREVKEVMRSIYSIMSD